MSTKRKTTTAIVAGVTAAAMLLGGTFAWTSISQTAKNEAAGIVNVGGRLHDDFNGTNKDVYVENFTDPLDGGQPIYARIKLTEYMEVGQDAGGFGYDTNGDGKISVVPVVAGTDINDVNTWTAHVPAASCAVCATEGTCKIHDHWTWTMGGDAEGTDGSTIFMPTFNKDKDSLAADINGTYAGTNANDKVYYDDYVTYVTENGAEVNLTDNTVNGEAATIPADASGANALTEANTDVTTVIGTEIYDDDTDTADNNGTRQVDGVTHTAKQTATASVVTMDYWKNTLNSAPGNYWVYDEDGWAYWANPIMPGEATGLLLDGIVMEKNPGEKCYYAINVVGQFATVGDWEYFTDDAPSEDAMNLLQAAADNVTTVTVKNNGATTLSTVADEEAGATNTTTFTATAAKASDGTAAAAADEFTWAVYDAELNLVETSEITVDGSGTATLTVGADETNANLIIAAKHTASGAVGLSAVAIAGNEASPEPIYSIYFMNVNTDAPVTESTYPGYLKENDTWQLKLYDNDTEVENVTWDLEVVDAGSDGDSLDLKSGTVIDGNGILTIDDEEVTYYYATYDAYYDTYNVIEITATVGDESVKTKVLICNDGFEMKFVFVEPTTNDVIERWIKINTEYEVQICAFAKTTFENVSLYDSLGPILPGEGTFTVSTSSNEETDAVKIEDSKLTATATGEYYLNFSDPSRNINMTNKVFNVQE